jgi:hypothetical protein
LDPNTTYTITASNGWTLSMNGDGTVSMIHNGHGVEGGGAGMVIDPDPGDGSRVPPTA